MTVDELDPNMANVMKYVGDRVKKRSLFGKDLFKAVAKMQPELIEGHKEQTSKNISSIRKELQDYLVHERNSTTDQSTKIKPRIKKASLNLHS